MTIMLQKLDRRVLLVPMISLLAAMDLTSLGNAKVAGIQRDLDMTERQYSVAIILTVVATVLSLPLSPVPLLIALFGPNFVIPANVVLWGIAAGYQGIITSYNGLLCCRVVLGFLAGNIGAQLLIWFFFYGSNQELSVIILLIKIGEALGYVISGIFAYCITNLEGIENDYSWTWIFMLEGGFTVLIGLCLLFLFRSFSQDYHPSETKLKQANATNENLNSESHKKFTWNDAKLALSSLGFWLEVVAICIPGSLLVEFAFYLPSILTGLLYTPFEAQLLSAFSFAIASIVYSLIAFFSHKYKKSKYSNCLELLIAFLSCILCISGFLLYLSNASNVVKYASLIMCVSGAICVAPLLPIWFKSNSTRYAWHLLTILFASGLFVSKSVIMIWIFGKSLTLEPKYKEAFVVLLGISVLHALLTIVRFLHAIWYNSLFCKFAEKPVQVAYQ